MKKTILFSLVVIVVMFTQNIVAQKYSEVSTETVTISKGQQPAYIINIPDADVDVVVKDWKKLIRQNTKSKVEESGGEISILGTQIEEIYHNPINIYSLIYKKDTVVRVVAAFEIDSVFFDFKALESTIMNQKTQNQILNFMQKFALAQYNQVVAGEVEFEEDKLEQLNDDFKDLTKKNENLLKEIKSNEQKIKNSNDAIQTYESENTRLLTEIADKNAEASRLSGDDERQKKAKDELKSLEKKRNL